VCGQEVRALQGRHPQSFTATHGQSKPLLNGSVLRMSCSSQALDAGSIPVTHSNAKAQAGDYSVGLGFCDCNQLLPACCLRAVSAQALISRLMEA
jgi:hypothetical protein